VGIVIPNSPRAELNH